MRNFIKTSIITIVILLIGVQTMNAETKRALLVGISDYGNVMEDPNKWANISGANDVLLLSPLFSEHGYTVTSLVDSQATHANITNALMELAKESKKGDVVYIHFSMHGQPFEDLNGDEEDGWDEALTPVVPRCSMPRESMRERIISLTMSWRYISTIFVANLAQTANFL